MKCNRCEAEQPSTQEIEIQIENWGYVLTPTTKKLAKYIRTIAHASAYDIKEAKLKESWWLTPLQGDKNFIEAMNRGDWMDMLDTCLTFGWEYGNRKFNPVKSQGSPNYGNKAKE